MSREEHKHIFKTEYVYDPKKDSTPRWLIVRQCTSCTYRRATDITYENPKLAAKDEQSSSPSRKLV